MTFILTNDDGIDAPGIRALRQAIADQPHYIVAPDQHLSGCSHQINRGGPISIQRRAENSFAIGGTPGKCNPAGPGRPCPTDRRGPLGTKAGGTPGAGNQVSGTG